MSTITYKISLNNAAAVTLAAAGISSAVLSKKTNGIDTLTIGIKVASIADAPDFAFGDKIDLIKHTASIPAVDDCIFSGTVEDIPPSAMAAGSQIFTYVVKGPANDLQLCDFSQRWTYTDTTDGSSVKDYEPTVVLGSSNLGVRITSGDQVSQVIDYAILRGLNIQSGTFAAGVTTPYDERSNITCWDAIVSMLRYTPDYCLQWDYNTVDVDGHYCPTAHFIAPATMATLSYAKTALSGAAFTPRYDSQVPGILIIFNYTGTYDGNAVKVRTTQTAGNSTHPRRVSLVFDLEGSTTNFAKQTVEVEPYPTDWTGTSGRAWLVTQIPWLADIADADWTVHAVTSDGALTLPNRLISGSIISWMNVDEELETFTADITYTKRDASSGVVTKEQKKVPFKCRSTDATSKEYKKQTEYIEPEPVPSDLASNLYASWSALQFDGQFSFKEQTCTAALKPGMKINITGTITEWATMAALTQDITYDLYSGLTSVTTGSCSRIEADNLMSIYRAARGRRYSTRRLQRDEPADVNGIDGAQGTSQSDTSDGSPADQIHRLRVVDVDGGSRNHQIDLFPATTTFETPANEAATLITPREMVQPYMADGVLKAKLAQVLCSEGYGSEIPLGGSRPADPSSPATRGANSETDLSSSAAYNPLSPGANDGLDIWVSLGSFYDDAAGTPVLKDFRVKLTFPNAICPTISAAAVVTIDQPV